jgi:hypothetical protein
VPILPQQRQETLIMSGDNDPVVPLANATAGCAVAAILPQDAGRKALHNRGAWPIHGDRTLVEPPICMVTPAQKLDVHAVRERVFCAPLRHWAQLDLPGHMDADGLVLREGNQATAACRLA